MNLPRGDYTFSRVWTDTRTIEPGDLFVALVGERFDAHEFLAEARTKGAAGVVVSRPEAARGLGIPVYDVRDTLVALGALGTYRRRAWSNPVVAVVGTNGKTSTKELIKAALGSTLRVHATAGNLNNLIGVPLTLLAIPDDADVAVIEMGTNQPGEVAAAARDRRAGHHGGDVGCGGAPRGTGRPGRRDARGAGGGRWRRRRGRPGVAAGGRRRGEGRAPAESSRQGWTPATCVPEAWAVDPDGRGRLTHRRDRRCTSRCAAFTIFEMRCWRLRSRRELGVSAADAARGIEAMPVPPMRSNIEQHGAATLINDAYNSNPGSARAAIELLRHAGAGRQRVAVLATMLELGPQTAALHDDVARDAIGEGVEIVAAIGEFAAAFGRIATGDPRVITADDVDGLWTKLSSRLAPDAVILLKGSRGMRLERLVEPIVRWAAQRQTP